VTTTPERIIMEVSIERRQPKKQRHVFRRHKKIDKNGVTHHPFLVNPDKKEIVLYRCLLVHQPFATPKGRGVTDAWIAAVETINKQRNVKTGRPFFDPPVPVKTVRDRFEGAMTIVQEMVDAHGPLRNDNDEDEEEKESNELLQILKEIYQQKNTLNHQGTRSVLR
jgi:hypothetical protein